MNLKIAAISLMALLMTCSLLTKEGFSFQWDRKPLDLDLILPSALAAAKEGWIILDCRPKDEFMKGHIEGAFSFSWEDFTYTDRYGVRYRTLPPDRLAKALGEMGIDEETPVVVYGDAATSWGGEGWAAWVLSWLGHRGPIRLLAGGLKAWEEDGLPTERDRPQVPVPNPKSYTVHLRRWLNVSASHLKGEGARYQLVDVRSLMEWLKGRIPGARRISWKEFYQGRLRKPIDRRRLAKLLAEKGIDPSRPVVYYCTGGVRSGYAWLVHMLSGLGPAINFEGGMEEWQRADASSVPHIPRSSTLTPEEASPCARASAKTGLDSLTSRPIATREGEKQAAKALPME